MSQSPQRNKQTATPAKVNTGLLDIFGKSYDEAMAKLAPLEEQALGLRQRARALEAKSKNEKACEADAPKLVHALFDASGAPFCHSIAEMALRDTSSVLAIRERLSPRGCLDSSSHRPTKSREAIDSEIDKAGESLDRVERLLAIAEKADPAAEPKLPPRRRVPDTSVWAKLPNLPPVAVGLGGVSMRGKAPAPPKVKDKAAEPQPGDNDYLPLVPVTKPPHQ